MNLVNYLKNFENELSSDHTNNEVVDSDFFSHDNFNSNLYVKQLINKVENTNKIIQKLKSMNENLKNDIVSQINSNFNNYIVLISKMQAIDFLIENIEKPLKNIKMHINEQEGYMYAYEKEVNEIKTFVMKNEVETLKIQQALQFHKNYNYYKDIIKKISEKYEGIGNIIDQSYEIKSK